MSDPPVPVSTASSTSATATTTASSTSSSSPFICSVCSKSYKRREHLQRHAVSHASVPPHRCSICGSGYRRVDVLKRHFVTCQTRQGGALSVKRTACDRCVQSKRGCSTGQPCTNCGVRGLACHYSFTRAAADETQWRDDTRIEDAEHDDSVNEGTNDRNDSTNGGGRLGASDNHVDNRLVLVDGMNGIHGSFGDTVLPANTALSTTDIDMPTMLELGQPSPFVYLDGSAAEFLLDSSHSHGAADNDSWLDFLNLTTASANMTANTQIHNQVDNATNVHVLASSTGHVPAQKQLPISYTFYFLDNFTKKTGLVTFDCGTRRQALQVVESLGLGDTGVGRSAGLPSRDVAGVADPFLSLQPSLSPSPAPFQDPLIVKTHQILFRIREVATVKPRNSTVTLDWSPAVEQQCLQFFSPGNLRKFLALYWARWHPNVNMVHRPTFDAVDAKCVLVVAMALIGACMSPDASDYEQARIWFNCVEEVVFIDDDFGSPPRPGASGASAAAFDPLAHRRTIQALQASYIVCLYQNWEGTDESKQRIRRYRFSTVVSVARDIGIGAARHVDYGGTAPTETHDFHWKAFVAREQLIRTFLWIYLLDQAFAIFNNLPPRVMIKEMVMHTAWPESTFQATTAADCARAAHQWLRRCALHNGHGMRSLLHCTLREIVESFCSAPLSPAVCRAFADLGPLNLFCIVSAFHFLLFQKQNSFGGEDQLHAIRTGLANWKAVWELYKHEFASGPPHTMVPMPPAKAGKKARHADHDDDDSNDNDDDDDDTTAPEDMWRRTGFMRHSPEYWLLAHMVINQLSSSSSSSSSSVPASSTLSTRKPTGLSKQSSARMPTLMPTYMNARTDMADESESLHAHPAVDNTAADPILTKYDETSMRQVNDLISQFRNVQLM
ncbi:hypothetical protein SPBR_04090 [Sporothrix brasiliensis 5110]|uniref:Uncharacterized protein n=1 Tax=Sporothrix brasiliensis 5110 TaxID=1398154 RepID=A0A0C2J8J2_9PEZI|nr:uncharacterized protein SPBR_04090 [Sporothrix brasiliensis 5110]KIH93307.1 hypothetical protein SPBR_04090 [Sporothrix brasiliensis 5110]